jgi:Protein of unknown function (DUF4245)
VSTATVAPRVPAKKRRGRENVRDMLLSMAVCTAIIVPVWYLAQPPASDSKRLRVVDYTADVRSFGQAAQGLPLPGTAPAGWKATSSTLDGASLRIGWVTPDHGYVEYAAQRGAPGAFVADHTGHGRPGSTLTVGGRPYTVVSDGRHTSLVLQTQQGTVVVGGLRETADDERLTELATTLGTLL